MNDASIQVRGAKASFEEATNQREYLLNIFKIPKKGVAYGNEAIALTKSGRMDEATKINRLSIETYNGIGSDLSFYIVSHAHSRKRQSRGYGGYFSHHDSLSLSNIPRSSSKRFLKP